jgi:NAD(P)-dependent dehydrogenase (short-subunit alcohol dehydrogenase family)
MHPNRSLYETCNRDRFPYIPQVTANFSGPVSFHQTTIYLSIISLRTTPKMDLKIDRTLNGKVAIVTGAGCKGDGIGNGRAAALLLAEDGCSVVCVDREEEWAVKTAEMIKAGGRGASTVCVGDVTKAEDCVKMVATAMQTFGRLDILINNVGIGGAQGTAENVDMEEWARGLEVNVSSMVLTAKYAIPEMKKNQGESKGSIVNLGSVAGLGGGLPMLLYPTSKGAVVNLTQSMAGHHGKDGIRVNCVCPG